MPTGFLTGTDLYRLTETARRVQDFLRDSDVSRRLNETLRANDAMWRQLCAYQLHDQFDQLRRASDLLSGKGILDKFLDQHRQIETLTAEFAARQLGLGLDQRVIDSALSTWRSIQTPYLLRSATDVLQQYERFRSQLDFPEVVRALDVLRESAEPSETDFREYRPDSQSVFASVLQGVLEKLANFEFRFDTPKKQASFLTGLLLLIWSIYSNAVQHSENQKLRSDVQQVRIATRRQAEAIAALTAAVEELRDDAKSLRPEVLLRTRGAARLRQGPSGTTARVQQLRAGQRLRWLASFNDWRWVELVQEDGSTVGIRGWIYRRAIRLERETDHR